MLVLLCCSCGEDDITPATVAILSVTADGSPLVDGASGIDTLADIRLVFSRAVSLSGIESAVRLTSINGSPVNATMSLSGASTVAVLAVYLQPETQYVLDVQVTTLGQQGEQLEAGLTRTFTTIGPGLITEQSPCLSAGADCYQVLQISQAATTGRIHFYGSYPLEPGNARWEKITAAMLVIHGQNRDADQYYVSMVNPMRTAGLEDVMIILSPQFKSQGEASGDDLYWTTSTWREGGGSDGMLNLSSFAVMDSMIARLADKQIFPALTDVILAGHSSGATFVNTYAAANRSESMFPELSFHYVVANNQYLYYPEDLRYDVTSMTFVPVTGCSDFNHWPYGSVNPPSYLEGVASATIRSQITGRSVLYLYGSADTSTTGTLNTTDCAAVLLGPNRYVRGQYLFNLLEMHFPGHGGTFLTVPGVGHDNAAMFGSQVFRTWVAETL